MKYGSSGDVTKTPSTQRYLGNHQGKAMIGEILIRRAKIKKYQLDFVLRLQRAYRLVDRHQTVGELLIQHRAISPLAFKEALAAQEILPGDSVTEVVARFEKTISSISKLLQGGQGLSPQK